MIEGIEAVAVVAMGRNRVIGRDGAMPWRLPSDLRRFRVLTEGRPMIMGRKTLRSIGRLLPGRDTIVLTRSGTSDVAGALVADGPVEAGRIAADCARRRGIREIAIVGGAEIYGVLLGQTDRIELTLVDAEPDGDTVFPDFEAEFRCVREERGPEDARDSAPYSVQTWARR